MLKGTWLEPLLWFVCGAAPITLLCLLVYVIGQQGYRQAANDPQVELAQRAAELLAAGEAPAAVVPREPLLDLSSALSPWIALYDGSGVALESSGELDGAPPQPPPGVFQNASWWKYGHSWQPREGLRFSIAVVPFQGEKLSGYVVVGRSLALPEERMMKLGFLVLSGWMVTLGALFIVSFVGWFLLRLK